MNDYTHLALSDIYLGKGGKAQETVYKERGNSYIIKYFIFILFRQTSTEL